MCEVLLHIVSDSCLDDSAKDRQSIAGYVYKSLWNFHTSNSHESMVNPDVVFKERVMALRLAVSGTFDSHIDKLSQQLSASLTGISTHENYRRDLLLGLANLRQAVRVAVKRSDKESTGWKYLSLHISAMEVLYSHGGSEQQSVKLEVL